MEDKATEGLFFICNKDFMEIHSANFVVLRVQILQSHSANFVKQAYANCTLIDKGINNKKRKIRKDVVFLLLYQTTIFLPVYLQLQTSTKG